MLGLLGAFVLAGCGDVVVGMESGGTTASGAGGGSETGTGAGAGTGTGVGACATGDHFSTFGEMAKDGTIGITSDAQGVYWVEQDGSVWRAGPGGVSPQLLASGIGPQLYTITVDHDAVYVVDYSSAVWRIDKAGGGTTRLANGSFSGLTVDDQFVYVSGTAGVQRVPKAGGTLESLAQIDDADSLANDADAVYVRTIGNTGDSTASVVRVPKSGGVPSLLSSEVVKYHYFSQEIAADDTSVYWINPSAGTLMKQDKSGGSAPVAIAAGLSDPVSIAVDGSVVYVTVRGADGAPVADRAVVKVPKDGGAATFVAHGPDVSAYGLAVDATNAYWTEKGVDGVVATACK